MRPSSCSHFFIRLETFSPNITFVQSAHDRSNAEQHRHREHFDGYAGYFGITFSSVLVQHRTLVQDMKQVTAFGSAQFKLGVQLASPLEVAYFDAVPTSALLDVFYERSLMLTHTWTGKDKQEAKSRAKEEGPGGQDAKEAREAKERPGQVENPFSEQMLTKKLVPNRGLHPRG